MLVSRRSVGAGNVRWDAHSPDGLCWYRDAPLELEIEGVELPASAESELVSGRTVGAGNPSWVGREHDSPILLFPWLPSVIKSLDLGLPEFIAFPYTLFFADRGQDV